MSIQAIDPTSSKWKQDSEHGTSTAAFLIWRSGDTTQALTVTYTVEGDAVPGSDYAALSGSVTIPAGEIAASILVTPTDNASTIRSATLTVVLDWSFEYEGGWSEASVAINESYGAHDGIIENSWEKPEVSFSTLDPYAAELPDGPTSTGLIVLFRLSIGEGDHITDPPTITFQTCTDSVDVEYSVEQTGTLNNDYNALPGSDYLSDGIFAAPIIIAPNDDTAVEGDETVALTITPNPDRYVTWWPDVASVTIHDDDWANMPSEAVDDEWEVTWNSRPELPHRFDGNVLGNDTDPDGDALYLATADSPGHAAEFEFHCDGSFTYVPEEDFVGDDTFMYIASDGRDTDVGTATIHIIDHEPIAIGDEYEVEAGAELVVAAPGVLGNDLDEDDDELTAELRTGPSHGALTEFHADGGFTYVPDPEFEGTDQFEYYAYDGYLQSVPAIVLLQVVADPMKSDIRVHELDYGGGTTLASDDLNGTTIIGWTRHWKDVDLDGTINPRTSSGEFERPYAYARNEELKLEKVTFKTRGGAAPQAGATIKVRGTVVLNGADVAKAEVTATAAGGVYVANNVVPDDINAPGVKYKFPAVVTAYDKLTIRWEISKDNGTTWKDGNSTANVVYVTWAPPQGDLQRKGPNNPIAIPVMETLVAYGTRGAANNAATAVAVRDGIWLRFIGSAATRNDGKPMYYYRNWLHTARQESYAFLIGGSIKGSERDGQCGNWAGLMYAAILANGIDGAAGAGQHEMVMLQVPNRIEGMLFGGWLYGQANNQPPYTHLNVTAAATPGYPFYPTMRTSSYVFRSSAVTFVGNNGGQNTPNSPSMFTNHVVVKDNSTGKFYDSSYGRLWTGLPDFQTNAVTGFTRSNLYRIARTVAC